MASMTLAGGEFETITESTALVGDLRARIAREGPLTFRDFMQAALYHPRHGYYARGGAARGGAGARGSDYVTAPEVHPVFGALAGKQLAQMWQIMGQPAAFDVVEQGGGGGCLARDILRWAERAVPTFAAAICYQIVETEPAIERGKRALEDEGLGERVAWSAELPPSFEGCLLSNELLDAFPVHRVTVRDGELREIYVTCGEDGRFADEAGPLSTAALSRYFDALGLLPGEGCVAEVNLDAPAWIARAAVALRRGFVLTFDYGYEAAELYAPWRRDGTLLCFYRHAASSDPYRRIGMQDMTASVDFTTLRRAGEDAGLRTAGFTDQSAFLTRLGLNEGLAAVARERPQEIEEYYARRKVVLDLIDPARLGRIKVLAQSKGVPEGPLLGFADDGGTTG